MKKTELVKRGRPRRSWRKQETNGTLPDAGRVFDLLFGIPLRIVLMGYEIGKEAGAREEREKNGAKKKAATD